MRIAEAVVAARDPERLAARLGELLALPAAGPGAVRAGETALRFRAAERPAPAHVAFDVPFAAFDEVLTWAGERVELLAAPGGGHEFDFSAAPWHARAAYFLDDEGDVLELIARRDAPSGPPGRIRRVSEVGLPVADVPAAVAALERELGLPLFDGGGPAFAAVGDHAGLLIVVRVGRRWVPTELVAGDDPVTVVLAGAGQRLALPGSGHVVSGPGTPAAPG